MTDRVRKILDEVQELSFAEQSDLLAGLEATDPRRSCPSGAISWPQFADGNGAPPYRKGRQVRPVSDLAQLAMPTWPEDETVDQMIEYIYRQRREAREL